MPSTKWVFGVDPGRVDRGPVQFAQRLVRAGFTERGALLHAVQVLPRGEIFGPDWDEDHQYTRARMRRRLSEFERSAHAEPFDQVDIVEAATIVEGLRLEAERSEAKAIVVGRKGRPGELAIVRLGHVARRLARALPTTVIVTPADMSAAASGAGPVLLATDLADHSTQAAAFAVDVAERLGRRLMVAHVVPTFGFAVDYLGHKYDGMSTERTKDRAQRLRAWVHAHVGEEAAVVVLHGDPVGELAHAASAQDSPLIVTGAELATSRPSYHSIGAELAANAATPVAIVPPSG